MDEDPNEELALNSTTTQRVLTPPAASASEEATIQTLDAALQRAWAASEPLLMIVRTNNAATQQHVVEQLQAKASESGAWSLTAEANITGIDGPYAALMRALTVFVPRIATEPGSLGVSIRHRMGQATAPVGKLPTQFCPAFAPIATSTAEPEALSFGYARDRLETLLVRIFAALSPAEPPTVFFLRHAAHADMATLRILARVLGHAETRQFAVVAFVDVRDEPRDERSWASFIRPQKYVVERFDFGLTNPDDDVAPQSRSIESLPLEARSVLEGIAGNGQWGEVDATAAALDLSIQETMNRIQTCVEARVLRRQIGGYVFVDPYRAKICLSELDARERGRMHLRIGRFYAQAGPRPMLVQGRFVAAAHLAAAVSYDALHGQAQTERLPIALALLDAGRMAMALTAYDVADGYLNAAARALDPQGDIWSSESADWAPALDFARLECACATGDRVRATRLFDVLCARAPNAPEIASAWRWLIEMATRAGEHELAIERAGHALSRHGIHLEPFPSNETLEQAFANLWETLGERAIEEIADLDRMTDKEALEATEVLFTAHPSAQALGAGAADLVAIHLSRLALLHGNADASSVGFATVGAAIIARRKDHRTGTRFGKVALQLCEQRGTHRHHTAVSMKFAATMSVWTHPLRHSIDLCGRTYETAMACGDGRAGTRIAAMIAYLTLLEGTPLHEVSEEVVRQRKLIRSLAQDDEGMGGLCDTIEQFAEQQKGRSSPRRSRSGTWPGTLRLGHVAAHVVELMALVLTHEYEAALFLGDRIRKTITDVGAQILIAEYEFWIALAQTALRTTGIPDGFDGIESDFEQWADRCPQTFQHKHALILAERARLEGRELDAMRAYELAINEARENGFTHIEGLAAELAARFYTARDFGSIAATYFRTARNAYGRWGATSKVLQLDKRFPRFNTGEQSPSTPPVSIRASSEMDLFTAVKVAQTVSKEIVLQRLLVTLLKIATEHIAAERCHILLEGADGELSHAARAITTTKGLDIEVPGPVIKSMGLILPATLVDHVRTTHESVCLEEAIVDRVWADDPYITTYRPRSVACFPIMQQSTIVGMFYLENNSARGIFTARRMALLEFLANQAAISLEHAKLYADLARENTERRRTEQVLRKNEERLRRLVESADVIPWEVDTETGAFTFVGSQADKRFGWPAGSWKKTNFLRDNVHPDDRNDTLTAFARACAEGKHAGIDFRVLTQNGETVWLHTVVGSLDQENGQRLLSGFFFDITHRKQNEQELRDKLDIIERQKSDIRALSTPLLDVSEGIVAMPVLGELDEERAGRIMDVLLQAITSHDIRCAILDLTGVTSINDATAEQIGRIVRAVELVGSRAIVAGIRADVARAIVTLDVGLDRIETRATMKDELRVLMKSSRTTPKSPTTTGRTRQK